MSDAIELGMPDLAILPEAEAFEGEHLAEAAMVLIADGAASLVGERAREHAESCAKCAALIAEQALAASELHVAFAGMGDAQRERLVERASRADRARHAPIGLVEPKAAEVSHVSQIIEEPVSSTRRARGGGWWIAAGLLVAALASAPSLSGLARGISEVREALLVVVAVSLQAEQALRIASGRMEILRTTASWTAAVAMVGVGLWIARRDPRRSTAGGTKEATEAREGTR